MKKAIVVTALMALSFNASANCVIDGIGDINCLNSQPNDYRNGSNSPQIYENGVYRGNLNNNRYDPNSISNEYGRYGSQYSTDSINNPSRAR